MTVSSLSLSYSISLIINHNLDFNILEAVNGIGPSPPPKAACVYIYIYAAFLVLNWLLPSPAEYVHIPIVTGSINQLIT